MSTARDRAGIREWTDEAFARLEVIVREQEAARERLEALERECSVRREHERATIAALAAEYDELYLALDAYADAESQQPANDPVPYPPPWGVAPSVPTGFAAQPVAWEPMLTPSPVVAFPSVIAEPEPQPRRSVTAVIVVLATILALGLGALLAAVVSGGHLPGLMPTTATLAPVAIAVEPVRTPSVAPKAAAPTAVAVAPTTAPVATPTVEAAPVAPAKATVAKRSKKHKASKKSRKKSKSKRKRSSASAPNKRIGLPANDDPLAGA
jgi:hypothetical protein